MFPKVDASPVSEEIVSSCKAAFDVIYNPIETLLMKKARALGKTAVGGAAMLVYQAVKAHEIWYGGEFSTEDISAVIKDVEDEPLEFQPCPMPITYDDVLDAHHFIDKLEKDWNQLGIEISMVVHH